MKPEIYKDEGDKLMGAAFEVYNDRGYGMAEDGRRRTEDGGQRTEEGSVK